MIFYRVENIALLILIVLHKYVDLSQLSEVDVTCNEASATASNWWESRISRWPKRRGVLAANVAVPFTRCTIRRADSRVKSTRSCSSVSGRAWFSGSGKLNVAHNAFAFSIANFGSVAICAYIWKINTYIYIYISRHDKRYVFVPRSREKV